MYDENFNTGENTSGNTNRSSDAAGSDYSAMRNSSVNVGSSGTGSANRDYDGYGAGASTQANGYGAGGAGAAGGFYDYRSYHAEGQGNGAQGQAAGANATRPMSRKERKAAEKAAKKAAKAAAKAAKPKKRVGRKIAFVASLGLCFGLFAGLGFYLGQQGAEQLTPAVETTSTPAISESQTALATESTESDGATVQSVTYTENDISDVVEKVMPAMVSIVNTTTTTTSIWGQTYSQESASSGSGIIVGETDEELLIVTNNHVVEDANSLEVTFIDESTASAKIKGLDSDMDLAVIAVAIEDLSSETLSEITVATLGDSNNLKLGEPVIAIGNALGYGQSVTNGIISALNREIELEDGSTGTFIQTNAAINPGNSGGALLNIKGEVIGINSNKIGGTTVEGMGYAIPISSASPIIAELMERQTRDKVSDDEVGYMGITMQEITDQIASMYNMPTGIFVYTVQEGSAAEAAGIKKGDIITKFDGQKVTSSTDLKSALQYYKAGDTATVTVERAMNGEYESIELEITLGVKPTTTQ